MRQHDHMSKENKQRMGELKVQLTQISPWLKEAVPKTMARYLTPERVIRLVTAAAARPKSGILECSLGSVATSLIQAISLGLEPDGALGHCYLVPFKGVARLIIGYRGYIELAYRSNKIKSIEGNIAYKNDKFKLRLGSHSEVFHIPELDGDRGETRVAYVCAKFCNGGTHTAFMTANEVRQNKGHTDAMASKYASPWKTHFDEMAKKTVLRQAFKWYPSNVDMSRAAEIDADGVDIDDLPDIDAAPRGKTLDITPVNAPLPTRVVDQLGDGQEPPSTSTKDHVDAMAKRMQRRE